jgi:ACS family hexuronate transporter-like MFS transporter
MLGLGEAGNWPGAAKVVAEWFPARERGLAMGIFNSGVSIGSVVATPLIVWLQLRFGWKATFLLTGSLGFLWLALWLLFYESPERHRALAPEEYALIKEGAVQTTDGRDIGWRELLRHRQAWAIALARFFADPTWWLYITWMPKYLADVRHFSLQKIGLFGWLPFLTADAGSLLGGWFSGHLISRGWSVNAARKTVIVAGMLLMLAGIPAAMADDAATALGFICLVTFGFQTWINNVQTLPSDFFPEGAVASVAGLGGVGAGLGAILFTLTTGWVVDAVHSYTPILMVAGLLPVLGTMVLFGLGGRVRRLSFEFQQDAEERASTGLPAGSKVTASDVR